MSVSEDSGTSGTMRLRRLSVHILILLISIIFSLLVCEVLIRVATPFPIGTKSHRVADARFGYRLTGAGVDVNGFRNSEGKLSNYVVAAIGDSQTYGNNVTAEESWPGVFEKISGQATYNFGVPSYGIYTYHALTLDALERDGTRVIVGIFPANDFVKAFSYCDILEGGSPFWTREQTRLGLEGLSQSGSNFCQRRTTSSFRITLTENVALLSAFQALAVPPIKRALISLGLKDSAHDMYTFGGSIPPVRKDYVDEDVISSNLASPEVSSMLRDFERFAQDWTRRGTGRVFLLIIPSKEHVILEALKRRGVVDTAEPQFVSSVNSELKLEERVAEVATRLGIPNKSAIEALVDALDSSIEAGRIFYPDEDGHPYGDGYAAMARAAAELVESNR